MKGFSVNRQEVPENIGIFQIGSRVSLLRMNEIGELDRITDEEDWGIVHHPITISLFSVELDGKSTRVTGSVG
jgi:hypothetical protein